MAVNEEAELQNTFLDTLRSYPNQEMWKNLYVDEDGAWIEEALFEETLGIAHDGLYKPEISKDVCSTAVWMRCRRTKKTLFVAFAENTPNATSYRSEILGAIAAQLALKAASRNKQIIYPPVPIYYDNKGVLNHGSEVERELKEK